MLKKASWTILAILLLAVPVALAVQEEIYVCQTNTECIIGDYVYDYDYNIYTSRNCTLNLTAPNGTQTITDANLTNHSDGWFNYTFAPTLDGYYRCEIFCNFSGAVGRRNCNFVVLNLTVYNISSEISGVNTTLWSIYNQTDLNVYVGGNYNPNEVGRVTATLSRYGIMAIGETLNITIYYPDGSVFDSANMSSIGSGIYRYNFTTPSMKGDYIVNVTVGGVTESGVFTISTITETLHTEHLDTQDTIKDKIRDLRDEVKKPGEADVFAASLTAFLRSPALAAVVTIVIVFLIIIFVVWARSKRAEPAEEPAETMDFPE